MVNAHQVGRLKDSTQIWQLKQQFSKDSIVVRLEEGAFLDAPNDSYLVFDKAGELLFTDIANEQGDSTATFKQVLISSPLFALKNGLNSTSNYAAIKNNVIQKYIDADANVVMALDVTNVSFVFNANQLGADWLNSTQNIARLKISDSLQISAFIVNWN